MIQTKLSPDASPSPWPQARTLRRVPVTKRGQRCMSRSASFLFGVMLVALQASAEIFKCAGKDGLDIYQNFPCQFESMGWVPTDTRCQNGPSAPTNSNPLSTKTLSPDAIA